MNTGSTNGLTLLLSLAEQDGQVTSERIPTHMYKMDPSSSWAQTLSLLCSRPLNPSLPSCCHLDVRAPKAAAPL